MTHQLIHRRKSKPILTPNPRFLKCFKPKTHILDLSNGLLFKILGYIDDTEDYKNSRLVNLRFYNLLENVKQFCPFRFLSKTIYFNNHFPYKVENYDVIFLPSYNHIHFLKSECYLKDKKKHGVELIYDNRRYIIKKNMYSFGILNGVCSEFIDNKPKQQITYLNNNKHGDTISFIEESNIMLVSKYLLNIRTGLKKYIKNRLIIDAKFKNKTLDGETFVYYPCQIQEQRTKNILNFTFGRLDGMCMIREHDRILKLNFKNGY